MDYTDFIEGKIARRKEELEYTLGEWRFKQEVITVFHLKAVALGWEEVERLMGAAERGTRLVVCVDGAKEGQAAVLASMVFVDLVVLLHEPIEEIVRYVCPEHVI